jgi:competence protein ComFC
MEDPVQEALHKLKYRRDIGLGEALSVQAVHFVKSLGWPVDQVVPIPLGEKRAKERGYNQVALIARPLAESLTLKFAPNALRRRRETRSQVGLSRSGRRENVRGAFEADPRLVDGKRVLIMDDVATTGSTLSSAAEALFQSGACQVFAVTIARAVPRPDLVSV